MIDNVAKNYINRIFDDFVKDYENVCKLREYYKEDKNDKTGLKVCYETSDGSLFYDQDKAENHEKNIKKDKEKTKDEFIKTIEDILNKDIEEYACMYDNDKKEININIKYK